MKEIKTICTWTVGGHDKHDMAGQPVPTARGIGTVLAACQCLACSHAGACQAYTQHGTVHTEQRSCQVNKALSHDALILSLHLANLLNLCLQTYIHESYEEQLTAADGIIKQQIRYLIAEDKILSLVIK